MNHDEIIRMAREAGAGEPESLFGRTDYVTMTKHEIERFAYLVAAKEREACAKVCDETLAQHYMKQTIPERDESLFLAVCADCAAAIRARK